MISTEEIAVIVYQLLQGSQVKNMISGVIDYEREDYTKEDVIIVPHTINGEGSVRFGQININIHVPDLLIKRAKGATVYKKRFQRLIDIRSAVIEVLQNHFEPGTGISWTVGLLNPPIKEQDHNEHYVSIALEITVRNG